jgi:hypothetical protein
MIEYLPHEGDRAKINSYIDRDGTANTASSFSMLRESYKNAIGLRGRVASQRSSALAAGRFVNECPAAAEL